jgi:hypothetical protein
MAFPFVDLSGSSMVHRAENCLGTAELWRGQIFGSLAAPFDPVADIE